MKTGRIPAITKWLVALIVVLALMPVLVRSEDKTTLDKQLLQAARGGNLEQVKALLVKGADSNSKDEDGLTALMWTSIEGRLRVVKHLLEAGADVNAQSDEGGTALMLAAGEKHDDDVVKVLLEAGADVNAKDRNGCTAAWEAAASKRRNTLKLLRANGAEVTLVMQAMIGDNQEIEKLLDAGVDVNKQYQPYGQIALVQALQHGNPDTVKLFLNRGADVNAAEANGCTPLEAAAAMGQADIVRLLLKKGAKVNASILILAKSELFARTESAIKQQCDIVKMLKEAGATDYGFDKRHGVDTASYCDKYSEK